MSRPLDGIRVVDFSWFAAGPVAGRTLADFGADVIRVENEARVDGLRIGQPIYPGKEGYNVSGYFNNFNAGKRSFLLNMAAPGARDVAMRLIAQCDVMLTNFTPRVITNWGLDYESLRAVNPTVIAVYAPMQGLTGPHRDFLGFGAVLTPVSGLSYLSGFANRPPFGVGSNYPDYALNPGHQVIAIVAALRHRERTGKGQMIELSQVESVAATIGPAMMDYAANGRVQVRAGNRSDWMTPHGAFRCLDEARSHPGLPNQAAERQRWVVIAVRGDEEWSALCSVAAGQAFAGDDRFSTILGRKEHEDALEAAIGEWTAPQSAFDLVQRLQAAGVPAGVVHDAEDMLDHDDHLRARDYYVYLEHAETGRSAHDGPIVKLHGSPGSLDSASPLLGEHTFEVATEVLGYSAEEVAELTASGVLS